MTNQLTPISSSWGNIPVNSRPNSTNLPSHTHLANAMKQASFDCRGGKEIAHIPLPDFCLEDEQIVKKFSEWTTKVGEMGEEYHKNAMKEIDSAFQGKQISAVDFERWNYLNTVAKEHSQHYFLIATQALQFAQASKKQKIENYQDKIAMIFQSRMTDLKLVKEQLETLQQQENHELKRELAIRDQILKEEAARFDQCLKQAQFFSMEDQRMFDNEMTKRKQIHAEKVEFKKLRLDEIKLNHENIREHKRIDLEHEYKMTQEDHHNRIQIAQIHSQNGIEQARLNSANRIHAMEKMVEMIQSLGKSKGNPPSQQGDEGFSQPPLEPQKNPFEGKGFTPLSYQEVFQKEHPVDPLGKVLGHAAEAALYCIPHAGPIIGAIGTYNKTGDKVGKAVTEAGRIQEIVKDQKNKEREDFLYNKGPYPWWAQELPD